MSELRIPDQTIIVKMPREKGKIIHGALPKRKIEMFGAYQFCSEYDIVERNFQPSPPVFLPNKIKWRDRMFRLRINGKWYSPSGKKYEFFTKAEIAELLLQN